MISGGTTGALVTEYSDGVVLVSGLGLTGLGLGSALPWCFLVYGMGIPFTLVYLAFCQWMSTSGG